MIIKANNWLQNVQKAIFPPCCLLCGGGAERGDLCRGCFVDLPRNTGACDGCAAPSAAGRCGRCLSAPPPWERAWVPFAYRFPVDRMIGRFKYSGDLVAGRVLGDAAASEANLQIKAGALLPACLVPVPLHPSRARERGFDQAVSLARTIGRRLDLPVRGNLIQRTRPTRPQASLGAAERGRNLRGAFGTTSNPAPLHVALVDDVLTSGATAAAAARALYRSGAERVDVWCIARGGAQR